MAFAASMIMTGFRCLVLFIVALLLFGCGKTLLQCITSWITAKITRNSYRMKGVMRRARPSPVHTARRISILGSDGDGPFQAVKPN